MYSKKCTNEYVNRIVEINSVYQLITKITKEPNNFIIDETNEENIVILIS